MVKKSPTVEPSIAERVGAAIIVICSLSNSLFLPLLSSKLGASGAVNTTRGVNGTLETLSIAAPLEL